MSQELISYQNYIWYFKFEFHKLICMWVMDLCIRHVTLFATWNLWSAHTPKVLILKDSSSFFRNLCSNFICLCFAYYVNCWSFSVQLTIWSSCSECHEHISVSISTSLNVFWIFWLTFNCYTYLWGIIVQ